MAKEIKKNQEVEVKAETMEQQEEKAETAETKSEDNVKESFFKKHRKVIIAGLAAAAVGGIAAAAKFCRTKSEPEECEDCNTSVDEVEE